MYRLILDADIKSILKQNCETGPLHSTKLKIKQRGVDKVR